MEPAWVEEVLGFWFDLTPEQWWKGGSIDGEISERFGPLWEQRRREPAASFLASARESVAAVILFDQFPRNMFRDQPQSFVTDALALRIAEEAILRGFDEELGQAARGFLYMPFQHSESLSDQDRSVELFDRLGDERQIFFARLHHDMIARFGRFPHRNAILGRKPTPEEQAAGDVEPW